MMNAQAMGLAHRRAFEEARALNSTETSGPLL
jgi:hypothetical protein